MPLSSKTTHTKCREWHTKVEAGLEAHQIHHISYLTDGAFTERHLGYELEEDAITSGHTQPMTALVLMFSPSFFPTISLVSLELMENTARRTAVVVFNPEPMQLFWKITMPIMVSWSRSPLPVTAPYFKETLLESTSRTIAQQLICFPLECLNMSLRTRSSSLA